MRYSNFYEVQHPKSQNMFQLLGDMSAAVSSLCKGIKDRTCDIFSALRPRGMQNKSSADNSYGSFKPGNLRRVCGKQRKKAQGRYYVIESSKPASDTIFSQASFDILRIPKFDEVIPYFLGEKGSIFDLTFTIFGPEQMFRLKTTGRLPVGCRFLRTMPSIGDLSYLKRTGRSIITLSPSARAGYLEEENGVWKAKHSIPLKEIAYIYDVARKSFAKNVCGDNVVLPTFSLQAYPLYLEHKRTCPESDCLGRNRIFASLGRCTVAALIDSGATRGRQVCTHNLINRALVTSEIGNQNSQWIVVAELSPYFDSVAFGGKGTGIASYRPIFLLVDYVLFDINGNPCAFRDLFQDVNWLNEKVVLGLIWMRRCEMYFAANGLLVSHRLGKSQVTVSDVVTEIQHKRLHGTGGFNIIDEHNFIAEFS